MLEDLNWWIIPVAALIPLVIGFIWYNPKTLGTAWMEAAGMTEEKMQGANMAVIFILSYVFACLIGVALMGMTIHQMGFFSLMNTPELQDVNSETYKDAAMIFSKYGGNFRTFGHGALHGFAATLTFIFPLLATNALFERKSWKYIFINTGYWLISSILMGGVICQFV